ncbi:MAG: hypothetical protein UV58_C0015G0013, partial [Candidatus Wolfebacteria bacterium GW2011_GWC1_43_10]
KTVFSTGKKDARALAETKKEFKGPKGGILLLLSRGYFSSRKTATEITAELKKSGYDYRRQVVQTALNRLSKNMGPLTTGVKEGGKKAYVKRK